jgi:hypothetical protein
MKHANQKTADDVIVTDADAGMRRLADATRHILLVPKSSASNYPTERKARRRKK